MHQGMDWDKLRTFYTVAKIGSFTNAGDAMSLSQSAVSRQIISLEEGLGIKLFSRHARGLILTEQGEILYQTVQDVFTKLALAEALLTEDKVRASGSLKIATSPALGDQWLCQRVHRFIAHYPDISLTIRSDESELNLRTREADVAIRIQETVQSDLIQRHLAGFPMRVYASQEYIDTYGAPRTLADLKNHRVLGYPLTSSVPMTTINWLFYHYLKYEKKPLEPFIEINSLIGLASMIRSGVGLGALPEFAIDQSALEGPSSPTTLVPVMTAVEAPILSTFYVYPVELRSSKRVKALRDFLMDELYAQENQPLKNKEPHPKKDGSEGGI